MQQDSKAAPLRLGYMVDTLVTGGAERLVVTFAQAARQHPGMALTVFVLSRGGTPFAEELRRLGVETVCLPGRSLVDAARFLRVVRALRAHRTEYLHAHLITSTVVGGLAAALLGIPFAATIHNVKASTARVSRVRSFLYRRILRRPRTTRIAVGQAVAEAARADTGGRACIVVPNAVSPGAIAPAGARAAARAALGVEQRKVLLAVGAVIGQKAYGDLLAAFAGVAAEVPDAVLLIAGNAPEPDRLDRLQAQARSLEIADRVTFLGLRRDIPALLAAADLFVSSSHWEGLPVSVLEAMANGLACVVTDVGDNRRILAGTGSPVVPAGQPAALAAALLDMLRADGARARAGAAARARAAGVYGSGAWVAKLAAIYAATARRRDWPGAGPESGPESGPEPVPAPGPQQGDPGR